MKTILITTLLFLTSNLFAQKAIYTDNDGDGIIEYTSVSKDGRIQERGFYLNGKMTGSWISYSSNGKKSVVAKFKNGEKHGTWFFYDEKGRITLEVVYKDNRKVSASQHRYASN